VTEEAVEKYMLLPFGWSVSMEDIPVVAEMLNFIREQGEAIRLRYLKGEYHK